MSISVEDESQPGNQDGEISAVGGSMFTGASNITINGGNFNAYRTSGTDDKKRVTDAMIFLSSRAEYGAPYDAAAREDVPKCHERTRVAIIDGIQKWAHSQEPDARPLMWIYGPAGSGKTTIMQTVAEIFDKEERLAASFFFSRLSAARPSKKDNFVITLAHQLSLCVPALREPLANALLDLSLLTKSLSKQLDALVTGPMKALRPDQFGQRYIFVVDGLDECEGDAAQRDILKLLEQSFRQFGHRIRILIASRSLTHIQAFFSQNSIAMVTQTTPLDYDYRSQVDIIKYLLAEFRQIRDEHPARCGLPHNWPPQYSIEILVRRASGQFIYASVVMKFIADPGRHPNDSLQTITRLKVGLNARPYEELDAVYAQVLSTIEPDNLEFIKTLFGCMLLDKLCFSFAGVVQTLSTTVVDQYFRLQPGTTAARINRVSPLVTTFRPYPDDSDSDSDSGDSPDTTGLMFAHASFREYLLDHSRSKDFFIDMDKVHRRLAHQCFDSGTLRLILKYNGRHDITAGPTLTDLIRHCVATEWTSELRLAIFTFDIQMALKVHPALLENHEPCVDWQSVGEWMLFIFWAEHNDRISPTDAEHSKGRLKNLIQSTSLKLSTSYNIDIRIVGILLTFYDSIDIEDCIWSMPCFLGEYLSRCCLSLSCLVHLSFVNDDIKRASRTWLCKIIVADTEMVGSFFADGTLYANLALLYARSALPNAFSSSQSMEILTIMLSKATPTEELTAFLIQYFLQVPRSQSPYHTKNELFTGLSIYLFEAGVPYIAKHQHGHDFDPYLWVCGICILFDPFKAEFAEIELSRDPTGTSYSRFTSATQEDSLALVNPVWYHIPEVPLLWLRAWILWLANSMMRLFPVAT